MFVLSQQHGFAVDITVEKPASLNDDEVGFSAELNVAARPLWVQPHRCYTGLICG